MHKIAFYGKGGIGKSTIAANISACLAASGMKVLHLGCDPKQDSTVKLTGRLTGVKTVLEAMKKYRIERVDQVIEKGCLDIDCIESGGPEPGVGCGGRAVSIMLETLERLNIFSEKNYDAAVFDVLGDVVCGGFAAPLRKGFAENVFIVVSEENMALYAANNIASGISKFESNGVRLSGLIGNIKHDTDESREVINNFAGAIGTSVIDFIVRDATIAEADFRNVALAVEYPDSIACRKFSELARKITEPDTSQPGQIKPLTRDEYIDRSRERFL